MQAVFSWIEVTFNVFNSAVLETGIGLVFVFLVVSLISSAVMEFVESLFKRRASMLAGELKRLLGEEGMKLFYSHPLVQSLARGDTDTRLGKPSYLTSEV